MKSLLSNYFNRQTISEETSSKIESSSFSSLASSSALTSSSSSAEQQYPNDSNLNIKYIDDIDTDGVCYSSTDECDSDNRRQSNNFKQFISNQMKSNETVIKTLEKINENFQFVFDDTNEQNLQNKQNNRNTSLADIKEWFFVIKRVTKESQDFYKKKMEETTKQEDCTHQSKSPNELQHLNRNLTEQIKQLTEKLNSMDTVHRQQKDELDRMKDICETMRSDRKRLKSDKIELLNQAKELYSTIESKENELRDFLRHYESKTKETSFAVKKLIDTKAIIEQEKIDLQAQVFELLEERNELRLLIESKNISITKLQKQLFEMNTKSMRHSLSKESDYGYVSTKASRDTLSTSLIENLKLNEYDTAKLKMNTRSKEERMMKCKSNDYQQQQQQILKSKLKNKSHQQFYVKDCTSQSNSSNQSIIDYENDLNKVLDSEQFIDLDSSSNEKLDKPIKPEICQSYSSDCILSNNTINTKQSLNKIDESTNNNSDENSSCTSSVVSFTKSDTSTSASSSSASVSNSGTSNTSSESESSSVQSIMSQSLVVSNDTERRQQKFMSASVHVEPRSTSSNQSRSSRILNSLIKMSTTAATVGSTGSSINFEPSIASKVPLFTTSLSSSKIKNNKGFNSTISMASRSAMTSTTKSLYSISDLKTTSNGNLFKQNISESNETEETNENNNLQVTCTGLKSMNCLKVESLETKLNNVNEWTTERCRYWLETIGMQPAQIKNSMKFIKSGKTLINMTDNELERAFLIGNNLHKRKLRLAIDELKSSDKCKYPKLNELTNDWVCTQWLKDIGLTQLKGAFRSGLIDGRVLNSFQKRDLEKYLGINKRNTQASLLSAIEFLRRHEFDIEKIKTIRDNNITNGQPIDTSLWTNENFIDWLRLVNLQMFSKNLPESGIHGALIQDNTFSVDFLYNALKVAEEPRYTNMKKILEDEIRLLKKPKGDSKDPAATFSRTQSSFKPDKKFTLRGSLGRALGKKMKRDISSPLIDDDTYRRIEFSHKIVDMKNVSTTSVV